VFWNVFDQPYFLDLVKSKVDEKIAKIKKPQFVVRLPSYLPRCLIVCT
jgi:hypothetical protein